MLARIRKRIKELIDTNNGYLLCKNVLFQDNKLTRLEVRNKLKYNTISHNVFFNKRNSGATRFVIFTATLACLKDEYFRAIVICNKENKERAAKEYNINSNRISRINNYTIHFDNGSTVSYMTPVEFINKRGVDVDHLYIDDYNQLFTKESGRALCSCCSSMTKMYRQA